MINSSFKKMIIIGVSVIYLIFSFAALLFFTTYNTGKMREIYKSDNEYSAKLAADALEEEKRKMITEARSIGASDNVFQAFNHNVFVSSKWRYEKDEFLVSAEKLSRLYYIILANQERNKIYGKGNGTEEKGIAIYNNEGKFLGASDFYNKEFINTGRESFVSDVLNNGMQLGGVELGFLQAKNDILYLKALVPVGKNSRFFYDNYPKGIIEVGRIVDGSFLDKMKKTLNKELIVLKENKILYSTIYLDKSRVEYEEIANVSAEKKENREIQIGKDDYFFSFIPLKDYNNKVIAFLGVGDNMSMLREVERNTFYSFIIYQIVGFSFLLIILYIFLQKSFKPFDNIIYNISLIGKGEYKNKKCVKAMGELNLLHENIEMLVSEIENREEELLLLNISLEEKVAERTFDLEKNIHKIRMIARISSTIHTTENTKKVIRDILEVLNIYSGNNKTAFMFYNKGNEILHDCTYTCGHGSFKIDEEIVISIRENEEFRKIINSSCENWYYNTNDEKIDELFPDKKLIVPIVYGKQVYGIVIIDTQNDFILDKDTFDIMIQALAIYFNNNYLNAEKMRLNKLDIIIRVLGSIVHEIKTPLVSIKGFANITKTKLKEILVKDNVDTTKLTKYLDTILDESERIDTMARDLLEYAAKRESFQNYERINLRKLIEEVYSDTKEFLTSENIVFEYNVDENIEVNAQKIQFKKIFTNLIKNAVEAKKACGEDKIEIESKIEDGHIHIFVADNGVGIPKDKLHEIFEPLVTTKIQGTGLGLTIVKDIVEKHGGKICCNSEENNYTEFMIKIPYI